jgi:hypothetical protein
MRQRFSYVDSTIVVSAVSDETTDALEEATTFDEFVSLTTLLGRFGLELHGVSEQLLIVSVVEDWTTIIFEDRIDPLGEELAEGETEEASEDDVAETPLSLFEKPVSGFIDCH